MQGKKHWMLCGIFSIHGMHSNLVCRNHFFLLFFESKVDICA